MKRLLLPLLLFVTIFGGLLAQPAAAGNFSTSAFQPWRDGGYVVGGGRAAYSGAGQIKMTCWVQFWWDPWWALGRWESRGSHTVTGYGTVMAGPRAPHASGTWRTRCQVYNTSDRSDEVYFTSYRVAL